MRALLLKISFSIAIILLIPSTVYSWDPSTFDFREECLEHVAVENEDQLREILSNVDDYAMTGESYRLLCLSGGKISVKNGPVLVGNFQDIPLVIHNLNMEFSSIDKTTQLIVLGQKVILEDADIEIWSYILDHEMTSDMYGVRLLGNDHMLLNSSVLGFEECVAIVGDNNVISGGEYNSIDLEGYGNQIKEITLEVGSIKAGCKWNNYGEAPEGPNCTIGPDIKSSSIGASSIYVEEDSEKVFITRNDPKIPIRSYYIRTYTIEKVGVINPYEHQENGEYHYLGLLDPEEGQSALNGRVEMFKVSGYDGGFVRECEIKNNGGSPIPLYDSDGEVKYVIERGVVYFDCGYEKLESFDEVSFTYTDADWNTSRYSDPLSARFDSGFHCGDSRERIGNDFRPVLHYNQPSLQVLFDDVEKYAEEYEYKRVLCFPLDNYLGMDLFYSHRFDDMKGLHIENPPDEKRLIIADLNLEARDWDDLFENALMTIEGEGVEIYGSKIGMAEDELPVPVGIRMYGKKHGIYGSDIYGFINNVELTGSGYHIADSEITINADDGIAIYAGCEVDSSLGGANCTIGPYNKFRTKYSNIYPYGLYVPSFANGVTNTKNSFSWSYNKVFVEEGGNNRAITHIPASDIGIPSIPMSSKEFIVALPDKYCSDNSRVELYEAGDWDYQIATYGIGYAKDCRLRKLESSTSIRSMVPSDESSIIKMINGDGDEYEIYLNTLQAGTCISECSLDSSLQKTSRYVGLSDEHGNSTPLFYIYDFTILKGDCAFIDTPYDDNEVFSEVGDEQEMPLPDRDEEPTVETEDEEDGQDVASNSMLAPSVQCSFVGNRVLSGEVMVILLLMAMTVILFFKCRKKLSYVYR